MNKTKFKLIFTSICAAFAAILTVVSSLAWFGTFNSIVTDEDNGVGGGFLSYFDSGTGSQNSPFVIATAEHYENMVRLQYEKEGWNEKNYYYQFGRTDSSGNLLGFCKVDDDGEIKEDEYTEVLNLGGKKLRPLGTNGKPFSQHIDGKDLTVSNFTVVGDGDYDLGIFGYVNIDSSEPYIHNAYFSDFTIDVTNISDESGHNDIHEKDENGFGCVGYLAGHVYKTAVFKDVYVNNCTIDGNTKKARTLDSYGYYGKTDIGSTGSAYIHSDSYSFDLSAKKIFDAIDTDYLNVRDNPLRARVGVDSDDMGRHYTDYDFPIEGEGEEWVNNAAKHPVSEAITRVNGQTYRLNGTTTEAYADRTYSLSSVGYQPLTGGNPTEYEITNDNAKLKDNTIDIKLSKDEPSIGSQGKKGDFFRFANNQWYYQHSENDAVTLNLSCPKSFTIECDNDPTAIKTVNKVTEYVYLDNTLIVQQDLSNVTASRTSEDHLTFNNVALSVTKLELNLALGKHSIAFFLALSTNANSAHYCYFKEGNTGISPRSSNKKNWTVSQGTFNVTSLTQTFNYTLSSGHGLYCLTTGTSPNITWNSTSGTTGRQTSPNSYDLALTAYNRTSKTSGNLGDSTITTFVKETYQVTTYDESGNPIITQVAQWVAKNKPSRSVDYGAEPVYISDAQALVDANYKFKNIDIVGGNVNFYYLGTILLIPVNLEVITLPPETQNTNIVELPEMSELDNMDQFYATKYCPGSVVMYVKNSGNALDTIDSQLGHIEFTYANMNIGGTTLINVTRPAFKKGDGNFVNIEALGRVQEGEQIVNFVSTFEGDITESGARKTSYCCLDSQGRMLGIYDLNGNPGYGFFKAATTEPAEERYRHITYNPGTTQYDQNPYGTYEKDPNGTFVLDKDRISNIATYVIVLGSSSSSSKNGTYITDIKFSYKAHEGSGGSFGPVGYRSANDTITDTILNFYFDAPAELNYSIKVYFNKNDSIYYITFSADGTITDGTITINIFNYEINNYSIYFNGSLLADEHGNNMEVNTVNYDPGG